MLFYNSLDSVLRDMIGLQINLARSAKLPTGLGYIFYLPFHFFKIKQSYLRIYWTDFYDFFHQWKVFA